MVQPHSPTNPPPLGTQHCLWLVNSESTLFNGDMIVEMLYESDIVQFFYQAFGPSERDVTEVVCYEDVLLRYSYP